MQVDKKNRLFSFGSGLKFQFCTALYDIAAPSAIVYSSGQMFQVEMKNVY